MASFASLSQVPTSSSSTASTASTALLSTSSGSGSYSSNLSDNSFMNIAAVNHKQSASSSVSIPPPAFGLSAATSSALLVEVDIDSEDASDPQAVTEYIDDICKYLRQKEITEAINPLYITKQVDLNSQMRAILIDWLVEVSAKFRLQRVTFFLAVTLIDRFLSTTQISRQQLQLVGSTALLLASKYEEIWGVEIKEYVKISDGMFTRAQILHMEQLILTRLKFNLCSVTPYTWIARFLKAARANDSPSGNQIKNLAYYYLELTTLDLKIAQFLPSVLAAASVCLALHTTKGRSGWNATLVHHTMYTEADLKPCIDDLRELVRSAPSNQLQAIRHKYSNAKMGSVAKLTLVE